MIRFFSPGRARQAPRFEIGSCTCEDDLNLFFLSSDALTHSPLTSLFFFDSPLIVNLSANCCFLTLVYLPSFARFLHSKAYLFHHWSPPSSFPGFSLSTSGKHLCSHRLPLPPLLCPTTWLFRRVFFYISALPGYFLPIGSEGSAGRVAFSCPVPKPLAEYPSWTPLLPLHMRR